LGDPTRLRLLALLESRELTVAELAETTCLAQPRVSTHLGRLREAGLVVDRRQGVSVYYRIGNAADHPRLHRLWSLFRKELDDAIVNADAGRLKQVMAQRQAGSSWPDSVAGHMERHYSPGRTWEATTHAMVQLLSPGRVLDVASGDGVMAELVAGRASSVLCIDLSERVVAAGRQRVKSLGNVRFQQGDMHVLPCRSGQFDTVLMLHALTYSHQPQTALNEAARVLARGGRLVGATLKRHRHEAEMKAYSHANDGFSTSELAEMLKQSGLRTEFCGITSIERRPPHFEVITFLATRP